MFSLNLKTVIESCVIYNKILLLLLNILIGIGYIKKKKIKKMHFIQPQLKKFFCLRRYKINTLYATLFKSPSPMLHISARFSLTTTRILKSSLHRVGSPTNLHFHIRLDARPGSVRISVRCEI